jgi:undecaprenyl-diphosphatase
MNFSKILKLDAQYSARVRLEDRPGRWRFIAGWLAHSGDSWFWFLGLGVVAFLADPYWQIRAWILIGAIFITAVLVMVIKFTVRRSRPEGEWGGIYRKSDPHSFPSGHAARGALIGVLATGLGPVWLGLVLLVWAPLMALARVRMGVHYFSDILVGMGLGAIMGLLAWQLTRSMVL